MATFSKELLSASTSGKAIKVAATATPGTLIHTAHATAKDEIWLYATNFDTAVRTVTIEFGGTAEDDTMVLSIPSKSGWTLVVPGYVLTGGLLIRAFADAANKINIQGYVNRIA